MERTSTVVAVDLTAGEQQPSPSLPGGGVQISGDGNVAVVVEGDVYLDRQPKSARKKILPAWNTKIGLPPFEAGRWTVSVYVVVCVLVVAAVMLMVPTESPAREPLTLPVSGLVAHVRFGMATNYRIHPIHKPTSRPVRSRSARCWLLWLLNDRQLSHLAANTAALPSNPACDLAVSTDSLSLTVAAMPAPPPFRAYNVHSI